MSREQRKKLRVVILGQNKIFSCLFPARSRLFVKPFPLDLDQMVKKSSVRKREAREKEAWKESTKRKREKVQRKREKGERKEKRERGTHEQRKPHAKQ